MHFIYFYLLFKRPTLLIILLLSLVGCATVKEKHSEIIKNQPTPAIKYALSLQGTPYNYGGDMPKKGFDCSGFVRSMFEQTVGKVLPRRASEQAAVTEKIDKQDLKPGDLVFFNTMRQTFSHVGIYVGDNKFIHSPRPGKQVKVEDMRDAYWERRFTGARRVPASGNGDAN